MLIGYVSDQRYVALADVCLEFLDARGGSWEAKSRASGAVYLELPPGDYRVILQKPGFGAKFSQVSVPPSQPHQFRLLADGLLGYAWPKWVQSGQEAEFRVHAVEPYQLELWRYGWQAERIQGLGWHDEHGPRATMQVTPDGDYTQSGVEWNRVGYANPAQRQMVAAPQRSGLYYFRAATATKTTFSFPWIVAPAQPSAAVAVLASNMTWNAYNAFGGRSNYIHADQLPPTPTVNARFELRRYQDAAHGTWAYPAYAPLSFERPEPFNHIDFDEQITDPIEGRQACHLAPAEWRLLGWMERESLDYDYYAESQLDDGTLDLAAYRVLVIAVHPEYWTHRMIERVKQWVYQDGGKLLYLGGNGLNCEVEIGPSGAMTCHNGSITSLWSSGMGGCDSRYAMRRESEASLLGVVFTPTGIMTGAPYRVLDETHWAFAGTGLRNGQLFGEKSLHRRCPGGASGHETDKVSAHSPDNVQRLAKGTNIDQGGAEMVHWDSPSQGAVFSVGSINYCASLPIDDHISQITKNVFQRFLE
ncbi:MAG: carboxypeptidase regulatory-like domain-containing protein [Planctomycetales bacterium]|nr:carboxypeptidase regulatory-like domain-containing protein [Planctomycetales bacterium]